MYQARIKGSVDRNEENKGLDQSEKQNDMNNKEEKRNKRVIYQTQLTSSSYYLMGFFHLKEKNH